YSSLSLLSFPTRRSSDLFQSTVGELWNQVVLRAWDFISRPSHSAARSGRTGVWVSLRRSWPVTCSLSPCRHWKSGPATRLWPPRSEEHTSELQSLRHLVC